MIQRKQTIYLLLALVDLIVCLCLPIGKLSGQQILGTIVPVYNLGIYNNTGFSAYPVPFIDIVVVSTLALINIFLFKKRNLQIKICDCSIILCILWYAYYAYMAFAMFKDVGSFYFSFAACLPFVAIVLLLLARLGIKADEELIRSMSRIR